jgi:hypothetical protein
MWLNLIRVTVPVVTCSGPSALANHYIVLHNFHAEVVSEFTLDTQAMVSEFDLKFWGFLMYLDRSDMKIYC